MSLLTLTMNAMELAACIVGFIHWGKIRYSYWRYFPFYLLIILLTELTGEYVAFVEEDLIFNRNIYRFFGLPFEFLFLFWLFSRYFYGKPARKWSLISATIYLVALLLDLFYIDERKLFFDSFSYMVGNILLLILLLRFFIQFSNSKEILTYKSSMMFWVCLGLMVFYLGSLPFYGLRNTLDSKFPLLFDAYWHAQNVLAYLMYCLFILAFLLGKPERYYEA